MDFETFLNNNKTFADQTDFENWKEYANQENCNIKELIEDPIEVIKIIDLGEFAWKDCLERIEHFENPLDGIELFWQAYKRKEDSRNKNRSAFVLMAKITVACLGIVEVEERLRRLKNG